jgi:hypothetical protein
VPQRHAGQRYARLQAGLNPPSFAGRIIMAPAVPQHADGYKGFRDRSFVVSTSLMVDTIPVPSRASACKAASGCRGRTTTAGAEIGRRAPQPTLCGAPELHTVRLDRWVWLARDARRHLYAPSFRPSSNP